jgi:glycosyltransferase involved in cell wall biosynthesis
MNILVVSYELPEYDKFAGSLRLLQMLDLLSRQHTVTLFCSGLADPQYLATCSNPDVYIQALKDCGISVEHGGFAKLVRERNFDIAMFEFYLSAKELLEQVRLWSPRTRIVVDSVDVHFRRLRAQYEISQDPNDRERAESVRKEELRAYRLSDAVITVTSPDRDFLLKEIPNLYVEIIPTIHPVPERRTLQPESDYLIFVGNFRHEPNVDAMVYFCSEVFPLILAGRPRTRLRVIGAEAGEDILRLASDSVEILGYRQDLRPYYESSYISIAPLRFGAGMKGKIGEAMSYGLPVVTTAVGADGFGFEAGNHAAVCDTPADFARAVLDLFNDRGFYQRLSKNGRAFIEKRCSREAVGPLLLGAVERISRQPAKRLPLAKLLGPKIKHGFDQHLRWRIEQKFSGLKKSLRPRSAYEAIHDQMRNRIPIIFCIDVEPDGFFIDRQKPLPWAGYEATYAFLHHLRPHLSLRTGAPVHFSWFLRMDPQVADTYGTAHWAVDSYPRFIDDMRLNRDEIGLHPHDYRWDEDRQSWVVDHGNQPWIDHCMELAFENFRAVFHHDCESFRYGDRWMNDATLGLIERLGAKYDLTLEPGQQGKAATYPDKPYSGRLPDYTEVPQQPFHPCAMDFRKPDKSKQGGIWMIPITSVDANLIHSRNVLPRAARANGKGTPNYETLNLRHERRFIEPAVNHLLKTMARPYLTLVIRSDIGTKPHMMKNMQDNLNYVMAHPMAKKFVFCTPAETITLLGLKDA